MERLSPQDARPAPARPAGWGAIHLLATLAASAAAGDWRAGEPFAAIDDALLARLPESEALRWRDAVSGAERPSRLGAALLEAAAASDPRCDSLGVTSDRPPEWLTGRGPLGASIRLAVGERLALERRYDACLAWVAQLDDAEVYSASLLDYLRAVAASEVVDDSAARDALGAFTDWTRERGVAELGLARWSVVEALRERVGAEGPADPLATVARRMQDVRRRLALEPAADPTQERQRGILADLDKLIEQLEQQRQQQQKQTAAGGQGGAAPDAPADGSTPGELKGRGEVDRKRLAAGDPWGALPPAERARLTQEATRGLPARYRTLIEGYFRTLADSEEPPEAAGAP